MNSKKTMISDACSWRCVVQEFCDKQCCNNDVQRSRNMSSSFFLRFILPINFFSNCLRSVFQVAEV